MKEGESGIRVMATIGEAPDSVRGLSRVQYSSSVTGKGYGGWLKAWEDTGRTVEVKPNPERE